MEISTNKRSIKSYLLFFMLLSCGSILVGETLIVGAAPGQFATIPAAVNAASSGDSILVLSGVYNMGNGPILVNKQLIIIGAGFRKPQNGGTQVEGGFEFSSFDADNSKLQGFRIVSNQGNSVILVSCDGVSNMTIENNFIQGRVSFFNNSNNCTVQNNIITPIISGNNSVVNIDGSSNGRIFNNILYDFAADNFFHYGVSLVNSSGQYHINNNFISSRHIGVRASGSTSGSSFLIYSNIFYRLNNISNGITSAGLYAYNISYNVATNANEPNNGFANLDTIPLFERFNVSDGFIYTDNPTIDSNLHLRLISPAIDRGHPPMPPVGSDYIDLLGNGGLGASTSDVGIYGGPFPFPDPLGAPTIPTVTVISVNPNPVVPGENIILEIKGEIGSFPGKSIQ